MFVCLGWGSLIWDPKDLPLVDRRPEAWRADGPVLPIEFARVSKGGRLTLVIDPASPAVQVLWVPLQVDSLAGAVEALHIREDTETDRPIGRWQSDAPYPYADTIGEWAKSRSIEGVVWTALGPKFGGRYERPASSEDVVTYLANMPKGARCLAEQYVRCAPAQINTPYRRAVEASFGWIPAQESRVAKD